MNNKNNSYRKTQYSEKKIKKSTDNDTWLKELKLKNNI